MDDSNRLWEGWTVLEQSEIGLDISDRWLLLDDLDRCLNRGRYWAIEIVLDDGDSTGRWRWYWTMEIVLDDGDSTRRLIGSGRVGQHSVGSWGGRFRSLVVY